MSAGPGRYRRQVYIVETTIAPLIGAAVIISTHTDAYERVRGTIAGRSGVRPGRATVLSGSNQPSAPLAMRRVRCRRWADRSVLVCKAWADRSSRSAGSGRTRAARRAPIGRRSATKTAVTGGPLVGVRRVGLDYFVGSAEPWSGSRWCVPRSEPVDRIVRDCGSYRPKVALRNAERRPAHQDAIRLRTWHRGDLV